MKLKCQRCKNEWDYTGNKLKLLKKFPISVSCSICKTSVTIPKEEEKKK